MPTLAIFTTGLIIIVLFIVAAVPFYLHARKHARAVKVHLDQVNRDLGTNAASLEDLRKVIKSRSAQVSGESTPPAVPRAVADTAKQSGVEPGTAGFYVKTLGDAVLTLVDRLAALQSVPEFAELDSQLELGERIIEFSESYDRIIKPLGGGAADAADGFERALLDGSFDALITLPTLLRSYFLQTPGTAAILAAAELAAGSIRGLADQQGIEIDTVAPLTAIPQNDPRADPNDRRGLRHLPVVAEIVRRQVISVPPNHALVVDCAIPGLRRGSRVVRPSRLTIYNHASWVSS